MSSNKELQFGYFSARRAVQTVALVHVYVYSMLTLIVTTSEFSCNTRHVQAFLGSMLLISSVVLHDSFQCQLKYAKLFSGLFICELVAFLLGVVAFSGAVVAARWFQHGFLPQTLIHSDLVPVVLPIVIIIATTFFLHLKEFGLFMWESANFLESPAPEKDPLHPSSVPDKSLA